MFEFFQALGSWMATVFVLTSMFNVGLTQKASRLREHLSTNRGFLARMLLLNFLVVPSLMIAATTVVDLDPVLEAGLLVFGLCAGAAFLVKLANVSQADVSLATTVLLVLMVGNIIVLPLVLPLILEGMTVDAWAVTQNLVTQMLLPLAIGMILRQFAERFVAAIQPWVARLSNVALYVLIIAMVIGYLPALGQVEVWWAIAVGLVVLLLALFLGWFMGDGKGHLQDVGALGTAQRGVAPAMIVAQANFYETPEVLMIITLVNLFGVVMLIGAAKVMNKNNKVNLLVPVAADPAKAKPRSPGG